MYCEKESVCKLCNESYQKILNYELNFNNGKKITWYKHQNGYILCSNNLFIHQIITGCHGNGKGTKNISVDHIDQDPLNNAWDNLRIATRKEQEQNTKGIKPGTKRERKTSAKDLPVGITQDMLKKYVVYYQEWLDTEHTKQREFFKVEKHPKLDKPWTTTKSNKISIQEKLAQANKIVDDLEKDVYPETNYPALPKYVSLITMREKPHLVFEKRIDGKRLNIKMVLPEEYDLHNQLAILDKKIVKKYNSCKESLNIFKYTYEVKLDDYLKYIKYITFDISRWGKYKETLNFEEPVTEQTAVLEVEKWLTNKATEEYFDKIKDNCYLKELSEYGPEPTRGRLLGDRRFLETLEKNGYESVFIECGS
jgi:hypothetical protein